MFRQLEFQNKVLNSLDCYLEELDKQKSETDKIRNHLNQNPELILPIPDFVEQTLKRLKIDNKLPPSRSQIPFSLHKDGCGRPVPNITLKVPTGGGKTWLAVKSASRILNKHLKQDKGFILWIVPNEAIFNQTMKNFLDREHPYRQALDRASAGRVKILNKSDRLDARDICTHLCIMILMLQSANRQTKETLKMFQDRGDVHGFVPAEGEQQSHRLLKNEIPNLNCYHNEVFLQIKDSLGNALRIIRPVVVVDEGHKAVSDLAYQTLYDLNPSFVLELTATPKDIQKRNGNNPRKGRYANLLVEITGQELNEEGMIKMPLVLDSRIGDDWKAALNSAVAKLDELQNISENYQSNFDRYIRPIMLIQVERTGKDQRGSGHIHADDVRDWLLQTKFNKNEVAIKTSEQNDLKLVENQDLLSPKNNIRVIITKEALQEGWDCPFAYVLCSLASRGNINAMTQLVGRILRQPHAEKTNITELDQCYVFTHQSQTQELVEAIKRGLEKDGLSDLVIQVDSTIQKGSIKEQRKVLRRDKFQKNVIHLPKIFVIRDETLCKLDYETDILCKINWRNFNPSVIATQITDKVNLSGRQLQTISLKDSGVGFDNVITATIPELSDFDPVLAVRQISDIVLNPFVGREIIGKLINTYHNIDISISKMGRLSPLIIEELRKLLILERDKQAEIFFKTAVLNGDIQFRLRIDGRNWVMPKTTYTNEAKHSLSIPFKKSLFDPIYNSEINYLEKNVAVYLDQQDALGWWHRNLSRHHYGLQGWRPGFFYPDFIFSVSPKGKTTKLVVLEMKGDHLSGNDDTEYKKDVMNLLSQNFNWDNSESVSQLNLKNKSETVVCQLILMSNWQSSLLSHF